MSGSNNARGDVMKQYQANEAMIKREKKDINVVTVRRCFLGMMLIALLYVCKVFWAISWLFSATDIQGYIKLFLYVVAGGTFLALGGLGLYAIKQDR